MGSFVHVCGRETGWISSCCSSHETEILCIFLGCLRRLRGRNRLFAATLTALKTRPFDDARAGLKALPRRF